MKSVYYLAVMESTNFSVIVPVYNEELHIKAFLDELRFSLNSLKSKYEIIVVDDGSKDRTSEILSSLEGITLISHEFNRGYGAALKTGINSSKSDTILIIDADGTYPVEKIRDLIDTSLNYDMVVAARIGERVHQPLLKKIAKWPINQLANYLVDFSIPDLNSGLRIFRKDLALKYFRLLPSGFSFTTNITLAFLSDGYRVKYIPINYNKRVGKSKVKIRDAVNYLTLIMRMILFYNPLKIFIPIIGVLALATTFSLGTDIYLHNLTQKTLILFMGFIQITILGFLADLINKRGHE